VVVQAAVEPELRWQRAHATRVLRRHAELTREAIRGASPTALIVWPENAIQTPPDDPTLGPPLRDFVARTGIPLLLGAPRSSRDGHGARQHFNAAYLLGPDGELQHYDKMRLLPFSEGGGWSFGRARGDLDEGVYAEGSEPGLFDVAGERVGILICFEAIYPEMARALARRGASALVNLSNDGWFQGVGGARQHQQLAAFRAIETGLPLVRATPTGLTSVVAPDGRVIAVLAPERPGVLRAALPAPRTTPTVYTRVGDAFAAACTLACGLALAVALRRALAA
jgi:apolipoprotein N-acyltransferase